MSTMIRPTELTDRSTASQYDTDQLRAAVIEWYERTGQAPRRREFDRDERTPHGAAYTHEWDTFAQARDDILSTHDPEYDGIRERGTNTEDKLPHYDDAELREWIVTWTLEMGEPPGRKEFGRATPTPSVTPYEERFEGTFTEIRDRILLEWLDQQEPDADVDDEADAPSSPEARAEGEQFPWESTVQDTNADN